MWNSMRAEHDCAVLVCCSGIHWWDTFTAGRYSAHGMNWVDQETCTHEQDKTSPPEKTPKWQLPHTPGIVLCSQDFSCKLRVSTHRAPFPHTVSTHRVFELETVADPAVV